MRVPNLGETELLVPLHEGVFEQPMWDTFLSRLKQVSGCACAAILIRAPGDAAVLQLNGAANEAIPPLRDLADDRLRDARIYALAELLDLDSGARLGALHEGLERAGLADLRAVRLRDPSGLDAWLVLAARSPVAPSVSGLMTALIPHLRVALRVLARLEQERARAVMNAGAFSHIDFGWIALDRRCHVVDSDEQAVRFLSHSGALRQGPYGRLTPSSPALDRELMAIVKEFATNSDARPRALNLLSDPWIDIVVSPVRVASLSAGGKAVAMVYLRGDRNSTADRCQQLVDVFKLTQSEARFAWSLAQGVSITDAAQIHGLTIASARVYSKKIYAKTGARGQVDFMRRVLTSVVALTVH